MAREAQTFPRLEPRDDRSRRPLRQRGALRGGRAGVLARRAQRRLLRRPRRLDRDLRPRRARPAAGVRDPAPAPVRGRARPVQRAPGAGERARRRAERAAARQARRLPPHGLDRERHRRDRHARVHPAPGRADPPRPRRRRRRRPGAQRRHDAAGPVPEPQRLPAAPARHRGRRRRGRLPRLLLAHRGRSAGGDRARPAGAEEPVARASSPTSSA